jgi:hypothetical protein
LLGEAITQSGKRQSDQMNRMDSVESKIKEIIFRNEILTCQHSLKNPLLENTFILITHVYEQIFRHIPMTDYKTLINI